MSRCTTTARTLLVKNGEYGIAHLTEAVDDVEYIVQYSLSDTVNAPDKLWANLNRNGQALVLTPSNTPLLLNVPGAYRFIENSPSQGTITLGTNSVLGFTSGDVK